MAKTTPTYIIQHKLILTEKQFHLLEKKFETGRVIYNTCLSIALKRSNKLKSYVPYQQLLAEKKSKERNEKLKEMRLRFGFSEYQIHEAVVDVKKHFGHLGINEAQKLATRAFKAVEKLHYGEASLVYFKGKGMLESIENKDNKSGLRHKDGKVVWGDLSLSYKIKMNDKYAQFSELDRTKYVRVVRKIIRGKVMYFAQLIKEGIPPQKNRTTKDATVGIDISPSTAAVVSNEKVIFQTLIKKEDTLKAKADEITKIQQYIDRSKRRHNPNKFNEDGTFIRGNKDPWMISKNCMKAILKLKDLHRKLAVFRRQSHECFANEIIRLGNIIKVEKMSFQGLQKRSKNDEINEKTGLPKKKKRFGTSILNYAPAMLLEIINRKLKYHGKELIEIKTAKVKASQFNHFDRTYKKKKLSERVNIIDEREVHRDLYSGFLIQHVEDDLETINVYECHIRYDNFLKMHDELLYS